MMVQHTWNKGFTLVEVCIVILGISVLSLCYLPVYEISNVEDQSWKDHYLSLQSEAMRKASTVSFPNESITWNEKGNVNQARTVTIDNETIVVELGGGRLVIR